MGNDPSSVVNTSADETKKIVNQSSGERGQKTIEDVTVAYKADSEDLFIDLAETDSDFDSDYDSDADSDDDEEDEELMERLRILEDAKQLKFLATAFLHPEKPVEVDGTACARCYFDRPSAPEQETVGEANYRAMVLADTVALRQAAVDYMHPELGVVTSDGTATARCYFDRPSAPEQESYEEAEERAAILADALTLKKLAVDYMHPELGVVTSDATSTARCYFDRPSAPEQESYEDAEERAAILADALALKKLAVDYMHPELGVVASDGTATARCYFDRFSASRDSEPTTRNTSQKQQKTAKTLPPTGTATTSSPVVAKHVVTKTITSQMEKTIKKSASTVELYGLDMDHGDDFY